MKKISRGPSPVPYKNVKMVFLIFDCFFLWQEVAQNIEKLKNRLAQDDFSALGEIRKAVLNLAAPTELV